MLTLASNERIPLKPHMRMIFEIRDLKHATPATVSRAGIIYISTDEGYQWRSMIASWVRASASSRTRRRRCSPSSSRRTARRRCSAQEHRMPRRAAEDMTSCRRSCCMLDATLDKDDLDGQRDARDRLRLLRGLGLRLGAHRLRTTAPTTRRSSRTGGATQLQDRQFPSREHRLRLLARPREHGSSRGRSRPRSSRSTSTRRRRCRR